MSLKDLFSYGAALCIVGAGIYLFGPLVFAGLFASFAAMLVVGGAVVLGIIAVVYYATLYRSERYAQRLREEGYDVHLDRHEIWDFGTSCLMVLIFLPIGVWLGDQVWGVHTCVLAGACVVPDGWYLFAPPIAGLALLVGLYALGSVCWQWHRSFRPLRWHYRQLQLGHEVDLPRLE